MTKRSEPRPWNGYASNRQLWWLNCAGLLELRQTPGEPLRSHNLKTATGEARDHMTRIWDLSRDSPS